MEHRIRDPKGQQMSTSPEELPETPDTYEGAAELDPDHWRDDPLIEGEDAEESEEPARVDLDHPDVPSEQEERDEMEEDRYEQGEEQIPPYEPRMGEALADLDVPENHAFEDEIDSSNDSFHAGGDPLD
jgi:hypothetical protein